MNIKVLNPRKSISADIIDDPKNIILFIQCDYYEKDNYQLLTQRYANHEKGKRATICWMPFDRYTNWLFSLLIGTQCIPNIPRTTTIQPPQNSRDFYYFNPVYNIWIIEPSALPNGIYLLESIKRLVSEQPFDAIVCQSKAMADYFRSANKISCDIDFPSTTVGTLQETKSVQEKSTFGYFIYDGSLKRQELYEDQIFIDFVKECDRSQCFVDIREWTKKKFHPRMCNGIVSYRRGSVVRTFQGNDRNCTIEQLWGGGTKINVAARAEIPLLGFWQDSYERYAQSYPFLEIGTTEFEMYLKDKLFREHTLNQCSGQKRSILEKSNPRNWALQLQDFLERLTLL